MQGRNTCALFMYFHNSEGGVLTLAVRSQRLTQPEGEYQLVSGQRCMQVLQMKPDARCRRDGSSWILGRRARLCTVNAEGGLRRAEGFRIAAHYFRSELVLLLCRQFLSAFPKDIVIYLERTI